MSDILISWFVVVTIEFHTSLGFHVATETCNLNILSTVLTIYFILSSSGSTVAKMIPHPIAQRVGSVAGTVGMGRGKAAAFPIGYLPSPMVRLAGLIIFLD